MFKKGHRQQEKNYRHITSTVTVRTTFEHMLSKLPVTMMQPFITECQHIEDFIARGRLEISC